MNYIEDQLKNYGDLELNTPLSKHTTFKIGGKARYFIYPNNEMALARVVEICNEIIEKENSPEPYIGITLSEKYSAKMLMFYGYPKGAVVLSVADASPAYQAGLRKGDIITEFNSTVVEDYNQFDSLFQEVSPNQQVTVKIYRNGNYYSAKLTVGSNNSVE